MHDDILMMKVATHEYMNISLPLGPITRARARQLNHQVSSFLTLCSLYLYNGNARTLVLLRNDGEDKKGSGFTWTGFGQQDSTNL